jgi:hypothetical protein
MVASPRVLLEAEFVLHLPLLFAPRLVLIISICIRELYSYCVKRLLKPSQVQSEVRLNLQTMPESDYHF